MPHYDFDAMRKSYASDEEKREPLTFTYGGSTWEVRLEPSLGDVLDLRMTPDVDLDKDWDFDNLTQDQVTFVWAMSRFIRRMLPEDQRAAWSAIQYGVDAREGGLVIAIGKMIIDEVITPRPLKGSENSADGQQEPGPESSESTDGEDL